MYQVIEMNNLIETILKRRSIRSYTDEPLTQSEIDTLISCAKMSPSGRNGQPLLLRVVTDKNLLEDFNHNMWDSIGENTKPYTRCDTNPVYHGAPAMFFLFSETENTCYMDAGIMVENIAIAAEALGLGSCIIGSCGAVFDGDFSCKWHKILQIPERNPFMIAIVVGHKNENPEVKPRKDENYTIIK